MLTALCGAILSPAELEIITFREGTPCMVCVPLRHRYRNAGDGPMSPLTSVLNAVHHEQLSTQQRKALTGLLLHLAACSSAMAYCPEMAPVQAAYRELLATGSDDQCPHGR